MKKTEIILSLRCFFSHQETKRKFFKLKDETPIKQLTVYPNQYPNHPLTDTQPIIPRGRPVRPLTPKYQIPDQKMMMNDDLIIQQKYNGTFKSPPNTYSLRVGLIGPVNAGKSQLFGALAHPISAVSPKASTTTEIVDGLRTFQKQTDFGIKNVQIKYMDTPGLMYKKQGFISKGWKVLSEIDFSLLVVDSAKRFDDMIKESIIRLEKHRSYPNFMKSLVLNKIDLVDNRRKFDSLIRQIEKYGKFDKIFYVSAKTGYGIEELQNYLISMSKQNEWQHPPEAKTTMTQTQIHQQILRQAIFNRSYKELPHDTDIECTSFTKLSNDKDHLIFSLFVATENQQRMVIGVEGANINKAKQEFRIKYAKFYGRQSIIQVNVKIRNNWRSKYRGYEQNIVRDQDYNDKQKLKLLNEQVKNKRNTGNIIKVEN